MIASACAAQEFAAFFDAQAQPRRLVGFSKRGKAHYATPGALAALTHPTCGHQAGQGTQCHALGAGVLRARLTCYKVCPFYEPNRTDHHGAVACTGLYQPGDWLLFGAETTGLPPQVRLSRRRLSGN